MTLPIISADTIRARSRYPDHSWPIEQLQPGQAFVIPMAEGRDQDGRSDAYIRTFIHKIGCRLGCKFSVQKVGVSGLAVTRIA